MTSIQVVALPVLLIWLIGETLWDYRDRHLPRWFSALPLGGGLVYLGYSVSWAAALLMAVSIAATEIRPRWGTALICLPLLVLAGLYPQLAPLLSGWLILWALWNGSIIGGADALAGAYLLLWFPFWTMALAILIGMVGWSMAILWLRYGWQTGNRLWVAVHHRLGTQAPGIGAFPLAALMFGLYVWIT